MHETTLIEDQQKDRYPGLRVRRDGDAVVVHIPMRLRRRNGRCMVLTEGETAPVSAAQHLEDTNGANRTLIVRLRQMLRRDERPSPKDTAGRPSLNRASTPASKTWPKTSAATAPTSVACSA